MHLNTAPGKQIAQSASGWILAAQKHPKRRGPRQGSQSRHLAPPRPCTSQPAAQREADGFRARTARPYLVSAAEQLAAGGRAERLCVVPLQPHAARPQRVQPRCPDGRAVPAHVAPAQVVGQHQHQVRGRTQSPRRRQAQGAPEQAEPRRDGRPPRHPPAGSSSRNWAAEGAAAPPRGRAGARGAARARPRPPSLPEGRREKWWGARCGRVPRR